MKLMTFLCFLVAASLYSSDVEDGGRAPTHVPLEGFIGKRSRCYQVCNNQDKTVPDVFEKVRVGYVFRDNRDGECFVHNQTTNSKLLVKMELERSEYVMVRMRMVYGEEESVVTTTRKKKGQRGNINIFSPRLDPVRWQPEIADELRPDPYGVMRADENGVEITRHFFKASDKKEGIFVRVCVQYKKLNEVTLSWGTEDYHGSIYNDKKSLPIPNVVDEQKVVFSALDAR